MNRRKMLKAAAALLAPKVKVPLLPATEVAEMLKVAAATLTADDALAHVIVWHTAAWRAAGKDEKIEWAEMPLTWEYLPNGAVAWMKKK